MAAPVRALGALAEGSVQFPTPTWPLNYPSPQFCSDFEWHSRHTVCRHTCRKNTPTQKILNFFF